MKAALLFTGLVACFLLLVTPIHAQTTSVGVQQEIATQYLSPNTSPDVPKNLHTWTQSIMIEVMAALSCQLTGIDPTNPHAQCLGIDQNTNQIGFVQNGGGAIGATGTMIAMLYNPPVRTSDYIHYLADNFGVVKQANAQVGTGFQQISPLANVWLIFRNLVYILFVIIFVVTGFAIMLRVKIDPRTVMTIENQIPNIIVGLLLVTFSFAIVGLMIDLTYLFIYMTLHLLSDPSVLCNNPAATAANCDALQKVAETQRTFNGDNALGVFNNLIGFKEIITKSAGGVKDIVQNLLAVGFSISPTNENGHGNIFILSGILNVITGILDVQRNFLGWVLGWIAGTFALLIIAIAILIAMFRLWFQLLTSYIYILLHTVFAPFWILGGLIPGSPVSFSGWLREMVSNFSVFPVTIGMFMMAKIFQETMGNGAGKTFTAPLIGNPGDTSAFGNLIAMGIVFVTPQVVVMMKDLLKAPPFKYSASIGQMIGAGQNVVSNTVRQTAQTWLAYRHGSYPSPHETGWAAVRRRLIGGGH